MQTLLEISSRSHNHLCPRQILGVRMAPRLDLRRRALACRPDEPRHYYAQLQAYQILPEADLFTFAEVELATPVEQIVSRAGMRVECAVCGEEIINEREIQQDGQSLCRACAGLSYYRSGVSIEAFSVTAGV